MGAAPYRCGVMRGTLCLRGASWAYPYLIKPQFQYLKQKNRNRVELTLRPCGAHLARPRAHPSDAPAGALARALKSAQCKRSCGIRRRARCSWTVHKQKLKTAVFEGLRLRRTLQDQLAFFKNAGQHPERASRGGSTERSEGGSRAARRINFI